VKLSIVTQWSANEKLGWASATYQPTVHCVDCPLKNNGCYAQVGNVGMHVKKLDAAARESHASPVRSARQEAKGIDALRAKGQGLRLHTSGDCPTTEAAEIVADAAGRFMKRGGGQAWTYTHAWRRVTRRAWGAVSVLASVETLADARRAMKRGFAPARVVAKFDGDKAWTEDGIRWIPCPAQTRDDVTCETCKLCWNADRLKARASGIAFEAHGPSKRRAAEACSR